MCFISQSQKLKYTKAAFLKFFIKDLLEAFKFTKKNNPPFIFHQKSECPLDVHLTRSLT